MIRKLVGRLNESLRGYLSPQTSLRRNICVPVTISIKTEESGVLRRADTGKLLMDGETAIRSVKGETKDLSENGLAFVVPSVRIGRNYLVGQTRQTLSVTLDLPNGKVCFKAVGERYEPVGETGSAAIKYLIGARITEISAADSKAYSEYLQQAKKAESKGLALRTTNN